MKFLFVVFAMLSTALAQRPTKTEPLDIKWQKQFKQLIQASECAYILKHDSRQAYLPNLRRISYTCNGSKKLAFQCSGVVYCVNDVTRFFIRRATCWSKDGKTCPTANECARTANFDTVRGSGEGDWKGEIRMLEESKGRYEGTVR